MKLVARDSSPLMPQPAPEEAAWLRRVATSVSARGLVVPISGARDDDEPIVYCAWDGVWWAGRYVGSLSFQGHTLIIEPRFGLSALRSWLFEATSIVLVEARSQLREDESFIAWLLASVWAQGFVDAARHGLPALRRDVATKGPMIRGRLDVPSSLRLIAAGGGQAVSLRFERSLDHAASDAIVAGYQVLRRWLGVPEEQWLPPRAKELLPQLTAVTGARPRVPTKAQLNRIRYTPITAGFAGIAELSRQIANRRGLAGDMDAESETNGVLLDVAELWEMYVLSILKKSAPSWSVTSGTRQRAITKKLLQSDITTQGMATLIPDAVLHESDEVIGIADAKYKSLRPSARAPNGAQREDLYQMAAYLGRFASHERETTWGMLVYPLDPLQPDISVAESSSPWSLDRGKKVIFATLPHMTPNAVTKMRSLILRMSGERIPFRA